MSVCARGGAGVLSASLRAPSIIGDMLPATYALPAAAIFVAGGALACLLGYRLFRLVLGIYGFVLGALLATSVLAPTETPMTALVAIVGGTIGAIVLIFAYFIGVAFAGAALAALLVHLAWSQFGADPHPLAVIAGCVVGALLSLALQRYVIILGTAFGGAWTCLVGVLTLMGHRGAAGATTSGDVWMAYPLNPAPGEQWVPIAWLILGSLGTIVQLGWTATPKKAPATRPRKARKAA
jgi:hypothetical protein